MAELGLNLETVWSWLILTVCSSRPWGSGIPKLRSIQIGLPEPYERELTLTPNMNYEKRMTSSEIQIGAILQALMTSLVTQPEKKVETGLTVYRSHCDTTVSGRRSETEIYTPGFVSSFLFLPYRQTASIDCVQLSVFVYVCVCVCSHVKYTM